MKREDTYSIRVSIGGIDFGVWDKMDGGEIDSEETRYKPGGLAAEIPLGGTRSRGTISVTRLYDLFIHDGPDGVHGIHWLDSQAGRAEVVITKQPLDADGNKVGRALGYKCKLKSVTPPSVDSESSDAALVVIEATPSPTLS